MRRRELKSRQHRHMEDTNQYLQIAPWADFPGTSVLLRMTPEIVIPPGAVILDVLTQLPLGTAAVEKRQCPAALAAGHIFFEGIGMLQARKLDGESVLDMADDAALHFTERDQRANRRPLIGGDTGA